MSVNLCVQGACCVGGRRRCLGRGCAGGQCLAAAAGLSGGTNGKPRQSVHGVTTGTHRPGAPQCTGVPRPERALSATRPRGWRGGGWACTAARVSASRSGPCPAAGTRVAPGRPPGLRAGQTGRPLQRARPRSRAERRPAVGLAHGHRRRSAGPGRRGRRSRPASPDPAEPGAAGLRRCAPAVGNPVGGALAARRDVRTAQGVRVPRARPEPTHPTRLGMVSSCPDCWRPSRTPPPYLAHVAAASPQPSGVPDVGGGRGTARGQRPADGAEVGGPERHRPVRRGHLRRRRPDGGRPLPGEAAVNTPVDSASSWGRACSSAPAPGIVAALVQKPTGRRATTRRPHEDGEEPWQTPAPARVRRATQPVASCRLRPRRRVHRRAVTTVTTPVPNWPTSGRRCPPPPPGGVTWDLHGVVALPSFKAAGPAVAGEDVARCYARTPVGALLATSQISVRYLAADDWRTVTRTQTVGAGRDAYIAERAKAEEERAHGPRRRRSRTDRRRTGGRYEGCAGRRRGGRDVGGGPWNAGRRARHDPTRPACGGGHCGGRSRRSP